MAKHGGGYVILDLQDAEPNNNGTESTGFINLTEQQVNAIKTAADEKLPVLYIGRGSTGDGFLTDTVSAAFVYAVNVDGEYTIMVPNNTPYTAGFSVAQLGGTALTLHTV